MLKVEAWLVLGFAFAVAACLLRWRAQSEARQVAALRRERFMTVAHPVIDPRGVFRRIAEHPSGLSAPGTGPALLDGA